MWKDLSCIHGKQLIPSFAMPDGVALSLSRLPYASDESAYCHPVTSSAMT